MSTSEINLVRAAGQYTLLMAKIVPQRPEHLIAAMHYEPRYYKYVFPHVHKWDAIPLNFNDIFYIVESEGRDINGTKYGIYSLNPHGRGKKFGLQGKDCRYKAGAIFELTVERGIHLIPKETKFHQMAFDRLLSTIPEINAKLFGDRVIGDKRR